MGQRISRLTALGVVTLSFPGLSNASKIVATGESGAGQFLSFLTFGCALAVVIVLVASLVRRELFAKSLAVIVTVGVLLSIYASTIISPIDQAYWKCSLQLGTMVFGTGSRPEYHCAEFAHDAWNNCTSSTQCKGYCLPFADSCAKTKGGAPVTGYCSSWSEKSAPLRVGTVCPTIEDSQCHGFCS